MKQKTIKAKNDSKIEVAKISFSLSGPNNAGKESTAGIEIKKHINLFSQLDDQNLKAISTKVTAIPIHLTQVLMARSGMYPPVSFF